MSSDGYTTDWSDQENSDSVTSYFTSVTEPDFEFPEPILEIATEETETQTPTIPEDRSLGEMSVPLSYEWIKRQLNEENLPTVGLGRTNQGSVWSELRNEEDGPEPERRKPIVSPVEYEEVSVTPGKLSLLTKQCLLRRKLNTRSF